MKRILLMAAGFAVLAAGIAGILLPLLPTTPFLLLAAVCFSSSNSRFASFLHKNRYISCYLEHYRNKSGVPLSVRLRSILFLWGLLFLSMLFLNNRFLFFLLPVIGAAVTVHICLLRPARKTP